MQVVTREIIAITAKLKPLLLDTAVDIARLGHTEEGNRAALVSTSLAHRLFFGNAKSFGYHSSELLILIGQIDGAIEAIQSAG
jgi:hypothetical protein